MNLAVSRSNEIVTQYMLPVSLVFHTEATVAEDHEPSCIGIYRQSLVKKNNLIKRPQVITLAVLLLNNRIYNKLVFLNN